MPELTRELQDPAAWRVAARLDPSDVARVVAWALTSPDAAAERLRLEHRVHRRDASIVPRPRLHPRWLCDGIAWGERLGFADRWEAQGRPEAPDAFGPPEAEVERSEASRVAQLQRASQLWDGARTEEQRDRARSWYRLLEALRAPRPAPRVTGAATRRGPGGGWSAVGSVALETLPSGGGR